MSESITEPHAADPAELDFWGFIDYAMTSPRTSEMGIDTAAARLFMTLNRATKLVFYDLQAAVRGTEVSEAGFSLLFILFQTGEITMKHLIDLSGMSKASVSAIIRTLAADRFAERKRSTTDGRSLKIRITETGEELVRRIYPEYNQRERAWSNYIDDDDKATLLRILTKLMDASVHAQRRM